VDRHRCLRTRKHLLQMVGEISLQEVKRIIKEDGC
jgi:hypothetical protein